MINEAESWLKVPFKLGGSTKEGCDCIHFLMQCLKRLGFPYTDPLPGWYSKMGRYPLETMDAQFISIGWHPKTYRNLCDIKRGDVVVSTLGLTFLHVSLVLSSNSVYLNVIGSFARVGVVYDQISEKQPSKIVRVYRYKGVN